MTSTSNSYSERDEALRRYVGYRVATLQDEYRLRQSEARADMAKLRRGIGGTPGASPELWHLTLDGLPTELTALQNMSRDERDGDSTTWERAAYDAITLHALHQQSRNARMHRTGPSVGTAARALGTAANAVESVRTRFHALGTAGDHSARLMHLRGLVSQFRSFDIPLDYARLAVDLRGLDDATYARRVLLSWGRDYHREKSRDSAETGATPSGNSTGDQ